MSTTQPRRVTLTEATPTEHGRVHYRVAGVGTFTLVPGRAGDEIGTDDTTTVQVVCGRVDDHDIDHRCWHPAGPDRDPPHLYGIQLVGAPVVDVDDALEHLATPPGRRSATWIRGWRRDRHGPHLVEVPDGTRAHLADIAAVLVDDLVTRPDAEEIIAAHRRHRAPQRARAHESALTEITAERDLWDQLCTHVAACAAEQRACAAASTPAAPTPPPPLLPTDPHQNRPTLSTWLRRYGLTAQERR